MRRTVVIILSIAILCSLFVGVFAIGNPSTENESFSPVVNAYEYANAPEGVYVVRYLY